MKEARNVIKFLKCHMGFVKGYKSVASEQAVLALSIKTLWGIYN